MKFPSWIAQPFLFNCASEEGLTMDCDLADELLQLQNDDTMKPIRASQSQLMWLDPQICAKYPKLSKVAEQTLLPFPTTYLVECGFNAVTDLLTKKKITRHLQAWRYSRKTDMLFSTIFFANFSAQS